MKKSQKWIPISTVVIPVIIIALIFILGDISIKEFPLWAIIVIPVLILITPFVFLLAQRLAQRIIYDADLSLQKKKKRILTVLGASAISTIIISVTIYHLHYESFCPTLLILLTPLPFIIFGNFRLFFQRSKN